MRAVLGRWVPVLAYMGLIFHQSAQPAWPAAVEHVWDKLLHVGGYVPLGWLCARAVTDRFRRPMTGVLAGAAWALAAVYAATDEWHQSFVPPRQADAGDWVADAIGAAVAVSACLWWMRRRGGPLAARPGAGRARRGI